MHPKSDIILAALAIWMIAAVSCAAMPVLHAVPSLQAAGTHAPLLAALALGLAVGVPLSLAARRLGDLAPPTKTSVSGTSASAQLRLLRTTRLLGVR